MTTITKNGVKYNFNLEYEAVIFYKIVSAINDKNEIIFRKLLNRNISQELGDNINKYMGKKVIIFKKWSDK